jgi:uncharacterized membrane protein
MSSDPSGTDRRPLIAAAATLGIGLGGFLDGILFHQVLQFHNMLSADGYYPKTGRPAEIIVINMQINMFWDGLFHLCTWLTTVVGLGLLWRAGQSANVPWSTKTLFGGLLLGWGLFNLVEGVINHHILHIHHVTETANHLTWDLAFLGSGVLFAAAGLYLIHAARGDLAPRGMGQK